jgi:hypothetical protein
MENINRPYHLLSRKNQLLTSSAIENAYRLIQENPDASLEELASGVHDFWIEENSWQGNPDQPEETRKNFARLSVPYDELPEDEKQKDRNFIVRALKSMEENSN